MAYILNQFNQKMTAAEPTTSATNTTYMTQLGDGKPKRKRNAVDEGVTGAAAIPFYDECIQFSTGLIVGEKYYFHAKIQRMKSDQTFYLHLMNYGEKISEGRAQYLKTITVQSGNQNEWVDLEIIFSPLMSFDCILFQLQRTIEDYRTETRFPLIVYEEFSKINNLIANKIGVNTTLTKIGVQSHPGLMMCINGEEIHIGRSGTYEVRNGIIGVEFFSVVQAASEDYNGDNPIVVSGIKYLMDDYLRYLSKLPVNKDENSTHSVCIFSKSKLRAIDAFVLDYMYKEE